MGLGGPILNIYLDDRYKIERLREENRGQIAPFMGDTYV